MAILDRLAYPDGIENVKNADAVLQLPLFFVRHGAEHHMAEVFDVDDLTEHDDQRLNSPKVLSDTTPHKADGRKQGHVILACTFFG